MQVSKYLTTKHTPNDSEITYGLADKRRHMSNGVLITTCSNQVGEFILVPDEYAMLGSLHISYSHLSHMSGFMFTCGFIPEILKCKLVVWVGHDFQI